MSTRADPQAMVGDLSSPSQEARVAALLSIIENPGQPLSTDAIEAMGRCLSADSKTIRRRAADALAAVARCDPQNMVMLRAMLANRDSRIRFGAAYALATVDESNPPIDTASIFCDALGDEDGDVRWSATELLVRLARIAREDIQAQVLRVADSDQPAARKMALYCIRDIGSPSPEAIKVAIKATDDSDTHVRLAALALLAIARGDPSAEMAMVGRLTSDEDSGVRRAAAIALGGVAEISASALAALRHAECQSTDQSLARAAKASLKRIARS